MQTFNSLHLENHLLYKDFYWQMDEHPFVVIRGINLDRKTNSANAVGKTILPSSIATLLTDAPPIKIKEKSAKDFVKGKASIQLNLTNDKDKWKLRQFAHGNSVKYQIHENGTDLQIKDIAKARQAIKRAFPLDEENVFSQIYLSSYRPSNLLYGKASARFDYFEKIFDMRIYDLMHRNWLNKLSKLNGKLAQKKILDAQYSDLTGVVTKDVAVKLKQVRQKYKDLLREYQLSNSQIQNLSAYVSIASEVKSELPLKKLRKLVDNYKKQLQQVEKSIDSMHEARGAAQQSKIARKNRHKLENKLNKLTEYNLEKIQSKQTACENLVIKLEDLLQEYNRVESHIKKYQEIIKKATKIPEDSVQILEHRQKLLNKLEHELEQKSKLTAGEPCPTCGIKVPNKFAQNLHKLEHNINKTEQQLEKDKQLAYCIKIQEKIEDRLLNLSLEKEQSKLAKLRQKLKILNNQLHEAQEYAEVKRQLKALPKEKKTINFSASLLKDLQIKRKNLQNTLYTAKEDIRLKTRLAELENIKDDLPTAQRKLLQAKNSIARISPLLEKISDKMNNLAVQYTEHKITSRQLAELELQLKEIDTALADRDIIEELSKAYSAKGIRIMQIQSLATAYISCLNEISGAIYSEPVKFYADIDTNKFNIIAERSQQIGDIRSFSGSESRQFLCISAPSLQRLMPNHLRCSHMILDEMESGLSPPDRHVFCHDFLPMLASSIPNLVVISPLSTKEFSPINAVNKFLVRENGITNWRN